MEDKSGDEDLSEVEDGNGSVPSSQSVAQLFRHHPKLHQTLVIVLFLNNIIEE